MEKHTKGGPLFKAGTKTRKIIFFTGAAISLLPVTSSPIALLLGLFIAQCISNPYAEKSGRAVHLLLQASVVGLGFGMNAISAFETGKTGFVFTVLSIITVLGLGFIVGRLLRVEGKISYLISAGTAICGGSAIAAVSPVVRASGGQISIALGVVFILNSVALFVFPVVGHALDLSAEQFGLWCAIAIHDTSSVVGAAARFGTHALQVATTVKLLRALWIVPLAFISVFIFKNKGAKISKPYFIGFFVLAMLANTYIPFVQHYGGYMATLAKSGLSLTLYLIGCNLSQDMVRSVGYKPLLQGVLLWITISAASLWVIVITGA